MKGAWNPDGPHMKESALYMDRPGRKIFLEFACERIKGRIHKKQRLGDKGRTCVSYWFYSILTGRRGVLGSAFRMQFVGRIAGDSEVMLVLNFSGKTAIMGFIGVLVEICDQLRA